MKLIDQIPESFKTLIRFINFTCKKITHSPKSREELQQYWKSPDDLNAPQEYLKQLERSRFLVSLVKNHHSSNLEILEIGCNAGRNLNCLYQSGFKHLNGIEISAKAVELLKKSFPGMASHAKIHNQPVEEIIKEFKDNEFGIVYTMAVLVHIHTDSDWIFSEIVRITKDYLIVIEDEKHLSWRHFPRNYKKIFETLGMRQIKKFNCSEEEELDKNYIARVFEKI